MSVIILLLIASLSVAGLFLGAFVWGVRNRQFEDGFSPPLRILFDDGPAPEVSVASEKNAGLEVIAGTEVDVALEPIVSLEPIAKHEAINLNPTKQ